jgi:hypothetical protein
VPFALQHKKLDRTMLSPRFVRSLLSSLLLIASQSVVVTGTDELPAGISSLSLPTIKLALEVEEQTNINIYKFRSVLMDALNEHLTSTLQGIVPQNSLVAIELDCVLSRFQSSYTSDVRASLEADCSGSAMVYESFGLGEVEMHSWVYEALTGDAYWELLHRFVSDDLLSTIQDVELSIESDLIQINDESASAEEPPKWRMIVLAVFATVLTCIILGLGIFAWWTFGKCCCGVKTACVSLTKEEDDAAEGGTDKGSDDGMEVKPASIAPPTRTKQTNSQRQLSASSLPKLSMIDECEEDDSSVVSSISAKIGKMLTGSLTHPHVKGEPVAVERVTV